MPYMSSGSLVSVRIIRVDVGEGVRGSRERRLSRCSSSYGMSIKTMVGISFLEGSRICEILFRHEAPDLQMWTLKMY